MDKPQIGRASMPSRFTAGESNVKIIRIETIPVQIPINPKRAIRGSLGAHTVSPFLLIKIQTDEGIVGLGEVSCTPIWSGEDQVTADHFIRNFLAPALVGEDPLQIERLTARCRRRLAANPFTKAGVEMALWDILGKAAGVPLYRLWGGPVRDFVPTKFSVSGLEPEKAGELAAWAVSEGFQAMKVKVGIDPEGDVARVRAVRDAIGPSVRLGVDANGGWSPRVAIQTIRRMYEFDIYFAEQPVPPIDHGMDGRCEKSRKHPDYGGRKCQHRSGCHESGAGQRSGCAFRLRREGRRSRYGPERSPQWQKVQERFAQWAAISRWELPVP